MFYGSVGVIIKSPIPSTMEGDVSGTLYISRGDSVKEREMTFDENLNNLYYSIQEGDFEEGNCSYLIQAKITDTEGKVTFTKRSTVFVEHTLADRL